jgi:hypothetical protein
VHRECETRGTNSVSGSGNRPVRHDKMREGRLRAPLWSAEKRRSGPRPAAPSAHELNVNLPVPSAERAPLSSFLCSLTSARTQNAITSCPLIRSTSTVQKLRFNYDFLLDLLLPLLHVLRPIPYFLIRFMARVSTSSRGYMTGCRYV